jgi:hypothetical protein
MSSGVFGAFTFESLAKEVPLDVKICPNAASPS